MSFNLLNIDSKPFVPKKLGNSDSSSMNINFKPFVPKFFKEHSNQNSVEKPKSKKYKEYFIIEEDDKHKYIFDYDYMASFENWEICQETKILPESILCHLEKLKIVELEPHKCKKSGKKAKKFKNKNKNNSISYSEPKNDTCQIVNPKELKKKLDKEGLIKFTIIEYLNMLTVANYKSISNEIYGIIYENLENQLIFLDILFNKSLKEKLYFNLYAKLCKDFDKRLPQRYIPKKDDENQTKKTKKPKSIMGQELLDKCKKIFTIEHSHKITSYFKEFDSIERYKKIKDLILGNASFLAELINVQVLTKKIVFNYVYDLLKMFNEEKEDKFLKMIYLEATVILLDKLGTLLKLKEKKMKKEDNNEFNEKIKFYLIKLEEIKEKEQGLAPYIKYKIINLIERSKNNWEQSLFEKSMNNIRKINLEEEKEIQESNLKKYTQEEVTVLISKDLNIFKEHLLEDEGNPTNYDWSIVESIYCEHGNSVAQMIEGFLYSCKDFVQNENNINFAKDYFNEIIFYYKKSLSNKEKKEIIKKTIYLLKSARANSLDNLLLLDVWSIILRNLIRAHLFSRDDLLQLKDLEKEDFKTIFIIIAKIIKEDKDAKIHYDKCKFVQQNKELYDEALKEIIG